MVYIISPRNAAELFQAALRTHYMHTDDVFMGILVNKTAEPGQVTQMVPTMSAYADLDKPSGEHILCRIWRKGQVPFYHVPDSELYLTWFKQETAGLTCSIHLVITPTLVIVLIFVAIFSIALICLRIHRHCGSASWHIFK